MIFEELFNTNKEEYWNVISHFIGLILSLLGGLYLLSLTFHDLSEFKFISVLIYSISMIMVYATSTLYHYNWDKPLKSSYRTFDHISIYYLIAGTYTPFLLITFDEQSGWRLLLIIWSFAFAGTIFKLFYTGKFEKASLFLYIFMGWLVLLDFETLVETTPTTSLYLLAIGGLLYSIGVIFYAKNSIRYNHVIWHLFVLIASAMHYLAVLIIVL